ncbi:hypothetical protein BSKO_12776 [Bryopsis sp. KO-2023]|nr:hypothetical protein BSKO_12776 [Bryopsis sp. KO-2023]
MGDSLDQAPDGHAGDGQASVSSRRSSSGSFGDWLKSRMVPGKQDRSKRELENILASQTMRIEGLEQQLRTAYARIQESEQSQRAIRQEPASSRKPSVTRDVAQRLVVAEGEAVEILRAQTKLISDVRSISDTWERTQESRAGAHEDIKWIDHQLSTQAEKMRKHGLFLQRLNDGLSSDGGFNSKDLLGSPGDQRTIEKLAAEVQDSRKLIRELRKRESSLTRSYSVLLKRLDAENTKDTNADKRSGNSDSPLATNSGATDLSATLDPQRKENSFAELGHLMTKLDALKEHLGKGFGETHHKTIDREEFRRENKSTEGTLPQNNLEIGAIKTQLEAIELGTQDLQNRILIDRDCIKRKLEVVVRRNEGLERQLDAMKEQLIDLDSARREALEQSSLASQLSQLSQKPCEETRYDGDGVNCLDPRSQFLQKVKSGTFRELPGLVSTGSAQKLNPGTKQLFNKTNVQNSLVQRVNKLNERLFSLSMGEVGRGHKSSDPALETTLACLVNFVKDAQHTLISLTADLACKGVENTSQVSEGKVWKTLNAVGYILITIQVKIEIHLGSEGSDMGATPNGRLDSLDLALPVEAPKARRCMGLTTSASVQQKGKEQFCGGSAPLFRDDLQLIFYRPLVTVISPCTPSQPDGSVLVSNKIARVRSAMRDTNLFRINKKKSRELAETLHIKCENLELGIQSRWGELQQYQQESRTLAARGGDLEREYLKLDAQVSSAALELESKRNEYHGLSDEVSQKKEDLEQCNAHLGRQVREIQSLTAELSSARAQLIGTKKIHQQQTQECATISSSARETYIELNEAKHQLEIQSKRSESLREELKQAKVQHHNTQKEVFEQTKMLQSRCQQAEVVKNDLETIQGHLKQCTAKLEAVNEEIQTIAPHLQQSRKDLAEKTNELESLNSELLSAKRELTENEANLKEHDDAWKRTKSELEPTREKLHVVRGLLETSTRETRLMQDELCSVQTALSEAESLLREKNSDFDSHSKQVNVLRPSLNDSRQKLQAMESHSQSLSTELDSVKNELVQVEKALQLGTADVETKTKEFRITTDNLDETKRRLKITVDEAQHITNELCMLKADLMVTRQLLEKKEDAVRILNDELDASQENAARFQRMIVEKSQQTQTVRASLEKSQQELEEAKAEVSRLEEDLRELGQNVNTTAQELNVFIAKKSDGGEELAQCKAAFERLKDELAKVKTSLSQTEENCKSMKEESIVLSEELSEKTAALNAQRETEERLMEELNKSKMARDGVEDSLAVHTKSSERIGNELADSQKQLDVLTSELDEKRQEEANLLSALKNEELRLACVKRELSAVTEAVKMEQTSLDEEELQLQEFRRKLAQEKQVSSLLSVQLEKTSSELAERQVMLGTEEKNSLLLQDKLDHAKRALSEGTKQLEEKSKFSVKTERELAEVLEKFEGVQISLRDTVLKIEKYNEEISNAKSGLESVGVEEKKVQQKAEMKSLELEQLQAQLEKAESELSSRTSEIKRMEVEMHEKEVSMKDTEMRLGSKTLEETKLREEISQVSSCLESSKNRLESKTAEVEGVTNKLTLLKADAMVTEQLVKQKEDFLARLGVDLDSTNCELKQYLELLEDRSLETERIEGELSLLKTKIEGLEEDAARSKKEIEEKKQASEELQAQYEPLQADLIACRETLEKESWLSESLAGEVDRADRERGECQKALSSKQKEVEDQRSQLQATENELTKIMETLQERQEETRTLVNSIELLHCKIEETEVSILDEVERAKQARRDFESMGRRHKSCEESLEEKRAMRQGLEVDVGRIGKQCERAQEGFTEEVERCRQLQRVLDDSNTKLRKINEELEGKKKQSVSLEVAMEKLKESLTSSRVQLEEESERVSTRKDEIVSLNEEISACSSEHHDLVAERDRLGLQRVDMKSQLQEWNASVDRLANVCVETRKEIEVLKNNISVSKRQECGESIKMEELKAEMESLNSEILKHRLRKEETESSLHEFEVERLAAESMLKDLLNEIERKNSEEEGIQSALLEFDREGERLKEELKEKYIENERLEEKVSSAKSSINEMRGMLETLEGKYHRLDTELKRREEERARVEQNINEQEGVCNGQDAQLETLAQELEKLRAIEADKINSVQKNRAILRDMHTERNGVEEQLRLESRRALDLAKEVETLSWDMQNMREELETKLEVRSRLTTQAETLRKERDAVGLSSMEAQHENRGCTALASIDLRGADEGLDNDLLRGAENARLLQEPDDRTNVAQLPKRAIPTPSTPRIDHLTAEVEPYQCGGVGVIATGADHERGLYQSQDNMEETSVIGMMSAHEIHKSSDRNRCAARSPRTERHREHSPAGMNISVEGSQGIISYPQSVATSSRASVFDMLGDDVRRLEQGLTDQRGASKAMEVKLATALDQISMLHSQSTPRTLTRSTPHGKHNRAPSSTCGDINSRQDICQTPRREKRTFNIPQEGQLSARSNRERPQHTAQGLAPIGGVLEVMESELDFKNEQIHILKAQIAEKQGLQNAGKESSRGGERDVTSASGILQLQDTLKHTICEMDKLHDTVALMCSTPVNSARGEGGFAPAPSPRSVATNSPRRHSGAHEPRDRTKTRARKDKDKLPIAEEVRLEVSQNQQQIMKLESKLKALVQAGALKEDVIRQLSQQLSRQSSANRRRMVWK